MVGVEEGGIDGPALSHNERLGEDLQSSNQTHDEIEENIGSEQGKGNGAKALPGTGAVECGCFIVAWADSFQSRQPNNHSAAGRPKSHQNERNLAGVLVL